MKSSRIFLPRIVGGLFSCTFYVTVLFLNPAAGQTVSFPGPRSEAKSPDGRYVVKNADDWHKNPAHNLALRDSKSGSEKDFYIYSRSVDVLWSPASKAFIVNDHGGSDFTRPVLFAAPFSNSNVDLWKKLIEFLAAKRHTRSALENHHVYLTGQKWLNNHEVLCKLTGYGEADPKGFTKFYIYATDKGFREAR